MYWQQPEPSLVLVHLVPIQPSDCSGGEGTGVLDVDATGSVGAGIDVGAWFEGSEDVCRGSCVGC